MASEIFRLRENRLAPEEVEYLTLRLRQGAIMVYPTETFYGLGGLAVLEAVGNKVFELKGREPGKLLPYVASDLEMVLQFAEQPGEIFFRLAERFWPGPLTLVLRAKEGILPAALLGSQQTLAVRVPPVDWLRELVKRTGSLLISTSANLSGQPPVDNFAEAYELFRERVDLFIDGGKTPGEKPSTIVDLTSEEPLCLREGKIPVSEIRAFLYEK